MTSIGPIQRARDPDMVVCLVHGTIPSLFGIRLFSQVSWLGETSCFRKNLFPYSDDEIHSSPWEHPSYRRQSVISGRWKNSCSVSPAAGQRFGCSSTSY